MTESEESSSQPKPNARRFFGSRAFQVMTYAASRGLRSGRAWLLLGGARDPECHVSASTCGRFDPTPVGLLIHA